MKTELIEHGRFEPNAIWINGLQREKLADYPDSFAVGTGTAIDLWKQLTIALVKAGQRGTLDAGVKEFI